MMSLPGAPLVGLTRAVADWQSVLAYCVLRSLSRAARDGTVGACRGKQSGIANLNQSHIIPRRRMAVWAMEYGSDYCR